MTRAGWSYRGLRGLRKARVGRSQRRGSPARPTVRPPFHPCDGRVRALAVLADQHRRHAWLRRPRAAARPRGDAEPAETGRRRRMEASTPGPSTWTQARASASTPPGGWTSPRATSSMEPAAPSCSAGCSSPTASSSRGFRPPTRARCCSGWGARRSPGVTPLDPSGTSSSPGRAGNDSEWARTRAPSARPSAARPRLASRRRPWVQHGAWLLRSARARAGP
jgi:hypothetical protein